MTPTSRDPSRPEAQPNHADRLRSVAAGSGPRVVLVHGFTQTAQCWGPFADALVGSGHQVVAVDAPGHGESADIVVPFEAAADLLGQTGGRAVYIGYSMGGRLALRLALDQPELVRALVLIGASPGIAGDDERAARRAADDALADRIEAIGVDRFLDEWLAQPLFEGLDAQAAMVAERRRNTAAGLASSLRHAGTGVMESLWDRLDGVRMPVLLLTGESDIKFTGIAQQMVAAMAPHAWSVAVAGAGHSAHLEQPLLVADVVASWLSARL